MMVRGITREGRELPSLGKGRKELSIKRIGG